MRSKKNKKMWEQKFLEKIKLVHKRNLEKTTQKLMTKIDRVKSSLTSRSKKYEVECSVDIEELRELYYSSYGTPCKYCGRILNVKNMVIDHIKPISKKGNSTIDNLQVICKTSNNLKGSLEEKNFKILLEWLQTVDEDLRKDITIRLSRGIH